jgi:hypothetical protein
MHTYVLGFYASSIIILINERQTWLCQKQDLHKRRKIKNESLWSYPIILSDPGIIRGKYALSKIVFSFK